MESILYSIPNMSHAKALCRIVRRSRPAIIRGYMEINSAIKMEHMKDAKVVIDRHKCAAAIMVAFEKRLIILHEDAQYEPYRERIAIHAGLSVMGTFMRAGGGEMAAYLEKYGGLAMPSPLRDEGLYEKIWAVKLRKAYRAGDRDVGLTALSLSNELFLMEKLTIEAVRGGVAG
ncbi:MAG: hypothetical protein FWB85_01265 [Chitinispirillia bacterium]|nr:hypothetical protein [Chitinispirillia bacterium]MCL2241287.1 hypothetical protein [Chitinispirillia bacterium]